MLLISNEVSRNVQHAANQKLDNVTMRQKTAKIHLKHTPINKVVPQNAHTLSQTNIHTETQEQEEGFGQYIDKDKDKEGRK